MSSTPKNQPKVASALMWLTIIGASFGVFAGLFMAGGLTASGITRANLPPLTQPTTTATTKPKPKPTPTETKTKSVPAPSLTTTNDRVPPGTKFPLVGRIPDVGKGATLQVQVKDGSGPWDDFPITVKTESGGKFRTVIYTSRTGERQFRLIHLESGKKTPTLTVTIG